MELLKDFRLSLKLVYSEVQQSSTFYIVLDVFWFLTLSN